MAKKLKKELWAEPDAKISTGKTHKDKNDVSKIVPNEEFEAEAKTQPVSFQDTACEMDTTRSQ
eukprot:265484-Ditylum_brightwellii.AAC.1